jgi:hypothetical protein
MKVAILFTGSRNWKNWDTVRNVFDKYIKFADDIIVIHGNAKGLDMMAGYEAKELDLTVLPMPAQWDTFGKSAGARRNQEMLNVLLALGKCGYEIAVEAFPTESSIGTKHMMKITQKAGVTVNNNGYKD